MIDSFVMIRGKSRPGEKCSSKQPEEEPFKPNAYDNKQYEN